MRGKKEIFRISGCVAVEKPHFGGTSGLRVEAWDKDLLADDLVGSAITDDKGVFQIEFTKSFFAELFLDRRPDLFFKVFRDAELLKSTEDSVLCNVDAGSTEVVIELDAAAAEEPATAKRLVVKGQVRHSNGAAAPNLKVRAFDRDLRSEALLNETATDSAGHYEVRYSMVQESKAIHALGSV